MSTTSTSFLKKTFPVVSLAGLIIVGIELIMQVLNTSVCYTEGCKIVAQYARYGDIAMLVPGILAFASLFLLSGLSLSIHEQKLDWIVDIILSAAITAEGFLVGYQIFRLHTFCAFCLAVFETFLLLGILRALEGRKEIAAGFAGFTVIISLFYLILPAGVGSDCDCIKNSRLTLFYNDACPHCKAIEDMCKDCDIEVNKVSAKEHITLFDSMNINEVPVLLVNDKQEKRILVGESKIREYLAKVENQKVDWVSGFLSAPAHTGACEIGGKECAAPWQFGKKKQE